MYMKAYTLYCKQKQTCGAATDIATVARTSESNRCDDSQWACCWTSFTVAVCETSIPRLTEIANP